MKKKTNFTTIFLILVMIAGLSLLLYPSVSDYWNSFHQTQAIASYAEEVSGLNEVEYDRLWAEAQEYNEKLAKQDSIFMLSEVQKKEYTKLLDISGTGIMGYIEIPSIRCSLPIYHGTEESALQIAVGHLEWSSLPVGGGKHPLRSFGAPGTAQCQAVYQSGSAEGRGRVHASGAG